MKWQVCGYCEYGYRLFMSECGKVYRFPIPYVFTEYNGMGVNGGHCW